MRRSVNSELIILAREAQGLTQNELANRMNIDQGNFSKMENGLLPLSDEMIDKISKALQYPKGFFYENGNTYTPQVHFYRKSKSLPIKELSLIKAKSVIDRLRIEKLMRSVEIQKEYYRYELQDYESPEAIANILRQNWKVPRGKIQNVTELIESNGILIFPFKLNSRFISDITTITDKGMYIIFINNNQPTDRKRFTLCHALGHIIMHNYSVSSQIENEADRFAGEFLMPANEIRHQLINLDIPKLANLKRYWGVSMAALIMRAKHLEVISDYEETQLWKRMSARGYRLSEPFEPSIKDEAPELLKKIISLYKTQLHYSDQQLEDFLFLHPDDREKYSLERTILRLVPNSFTEK